MTKILFLHGYTQSGVTLRHKTAALSKALARYAEITYPTAPIRLETPDADNAEERERLAKLGNEAGEGSFAWWRADYEVQDYLQLDSTLAHVKQILESEGPFDGVMGFSQGAAFAAILASLLERPNTMLQTSHPPFKFAVIFSGFRSIFPHHNHIYEPKIKTPMLHFVGNVDPIVTPERSQELIDVSENAQVAKHPGSHFVPSAANWRSLIVDYVISHTRARRSCTAIVAATDKGLGIGNKGALPWRLRKEMRYFADVTSAAPEGKQNVVIMGRTSWESIPQQFRPLKGRINIVLSRNTATAATGGYDMGVSGKFNIVASSLDDALLQVDKQFADVVHRVFIIGGAQLYRTALAHPELDRILFTSIKNEFECDTAFPIDFRRKSGTSSGGEDAATARWKRKGIDDLRTWTGLDGIEERQTEKDVEWEYEMWEKDVDSKL